MVGPGERVEVEKRKRFASRGWVRARAAGGDPPRRFCNQPADDAQQRRLAASARSQERNELALLEPEARVIQGDDRLEGAPADFLELKHLAHVVDHPERHHCARCCVRRPRNLLCANTRSPIAATAASRVLSIAWNILWYFDRQMPPARLVFLPRIP